MVKRKTHEEFVQQVYNLVGNEYEVIGKYINTARRIKMKHNICNNIFEVIPNNFLKSKYPSRCPICKAEIDRKRQMKTIETFKKEVYILTGNEYEVMGEYKGAHKKIAMRHCKCNTIWDITPNDFITKSARCPKCAPQAIGKKLRKTHETFLKDVFEKVGTEYTVMGRYIKNTTKIKMKHNKCGTEWEVTPKRFLYFNSRCPKCDESHGERIVTEYLQHNNIQFKRQFRIKGCVNKKQLPFDFAIFNKNKLTALIEYDGQQHKEAVAHFGGIKTLKRTQHNDAIKTNYCLAHNIPLIRIPCTVKNIEKYLDNELKKLNKEIQLSIL